MTHPLGLTNLNVTPLQRRSELHATLFSPFEDIEKSSAVLKGQQCSTDEPPDEGSKCKRD